MFSEKTFCDVKLAIGALVVAGFECRWKTVKNFDSLRGTIIVETQNGTKNLGTFRDGATFVVKVAIVQDIIDDDRPVRR